MKVEHGETRFGKVFVVNDGKVIDHYYINRSTGEITETHKEAVEWYRDGAEVEVWHNGRMAVAWVY